jgi:sugar lactone lactonase YvrE
VWVAEAAGAVLRKVTPAGVVTSVTVNVGNRPLNPQGMVFDSTGVLWLSAGPGIVRVATDGTTTVVTSATPAAGLARLADGNLIGTIRNNLNHIAVASGTVTSLAGAGSTLLAQFADGTGEAARFWEPSGIASAGNGVAYVTDRHNCLVRRIDPGGVVTTWAGTLLDCGAVNGVGTAAKFGSPEDLVVDAAGNIFVVDGQAIRKIAPDRTVTTFAGTPGATGSVDGTGAAARFNNPTGIAIDSAGNLYIADTVNQTVRKITPAAVVTTLAGLAGTSGTADGTGAAARFASPRRLTVDAASNVFVVDSSGTTVRKITAAGVVTTFAGSPGANIRSDGTGTAAHFFMVEGITVDATGNLYVADFNILRRITPAGVVTTLTTDLQAIKLGTDPTLQQGYAVAMTQDRHLLVTDMSAASVFDVTLP